jgi:hypothetical protein
LPIEHVRAKKTKLEVAAIEEAYGRAFVASRMLPTAPMR